MIKQYLTFLIDDTQYAIDVFQIQEVLEYEEPQPIPCSSPMLLGIIRSRDSNIAIMDLRKRFGLSPRIKDKMTRTIVLEIPDSEQGVINLFGIIADSVLEVIEIDDENLDVLPATRDIKASKFVTSVLSFNDHYLLILDTAKIFSNEDLDSAIDLAENSSDKEELSNKKSKTKSRTTKSKIKSKEVEE